MIAAALGPALQVGGRGEPPPAGDAEPHEAHGAGRGEAVVEQLEYIYVYWLDCNSSNRLG